MARIRGRDIRWELETRNWRPKAAHRRPENADVQFPVSSFQFLS
jgi:hypothetical protein